MLLELVVHVIVARMKHPPACTHVYSQQTFRLDTKVHVSTVSCLSNSSEGLTGYTGVKQVRGYWYYSHL